MLLNYLRTINNMQGYCLKCKKKVEIINIKEIIFKRKNGSEGRRISGNCQICNTKISKILPNK